MQVSFIIPLYNCLALTRAMLESLQATLPRNLSHEIILVDDGSTDGTREWLAILQAPFRVILNERNLGYAGANNRGATKAQGEILYFLNNDLVLSKGWFQPMYNKVRRNFRTGLVGNVQLHATTGEMDHCGVDFSTKGKPIHLTKYSLWSRLTGYRRTLALTGACFCITRKLWTQLGSFDSSYINGCEDIDLCLRALDTGYKNYVSLRSVVGHHVSQSPGRKLRDEQNTRRLVRRWRKEITPRATHHYAREWCKDFIVRHWDQSYVFDDALARHALACFLGLSRTAPPPVLPIVNEVIDKEFAHWDRLLGPES